MLSNNFKIIDENNIKININIFEELQTYKVNNNSIKHISYSNYLPDKEKIIFSHRLTKRSKYNLEETKIGDLKDGNIENIKNLLKINNISHNLSIFKFEDKYIGFGGVYCRNKCSKSKNQQGLFTLLFDKDLKLINNYKLVITPKMAKSTPLNHFMFDSNISFLKYKNKYYLYVRFNRNPGFRETQIFISDKPDKDYKYFNLVNLNENNIYNYTQNIFIENNIFIGIFRYYINNSCDIYKKKIGILQAHSFDGFNFTIDNKKIFENKDNFDLFVNNYKIKNSFNYFFKNNLLKKNFTKFRIRRGGYINYEPSDKTIETKINIEIIKKINTILINYKIDENGYIKLYFYNQNNELVNNLDLEGDRIAHKIDIKNEYKFIKFLFLNSNIYQIL